jgi:hypothetical protein
MTADSVSYHFQRLFHRVALGQAPRQLGAFGPIPAVLKVRVKDYGEVTSTDLNGMDLILPVMCPIRFYCSRMPGYLFVIRTIPPM